MFWIALLFILAAFTGGYLIGWARGVRGLPRWPLRVGKDGIHRQPLVWFALVASALLGCTLEVSCTSERSPDSTVTAPRDSAEHHGDHDRDHDKGKKKHPHEDAATP